MNCGYCYEVIEKPKYNQKFCSYEHNKLYHALIKCREPSRLDDDLRLKRNEILKRIKSEGDL